MQAIAQSSPCTWWALYVNSWITLGLLLDYASGSTNLSTHWDAVQMASDPIDRLITKTRPDPQMPDSVIFAWIPLGLLSGSVYGSALGRVRARWRPRRWKRSCEAAELRSRDASCGAMELRSSEAAELRRELWSHKATKPQSRGASEAAVADVDIARRLIYQTPSCEVRTNALQQLVVLF